MDFSERPGAETLRAAIMNDKKTMAFIDDAANEAEIYEALFLNPAVAAWGGGDDLIVWLDKISAMRDLNTTGEPDEMSQRARHLRERLQAIKKRGDEVLGEIRTCEFCMNDEVHPDDEESA